MSVNHKQIKSKKEMKSSNIVIVTALVSILSFPVLLSLFSLIIMKYHTEPTVLQIFVIIAFGISAFMSAFISSFFVKSRRLIAGILTALSATICEFLFLLFINHMHVSLTCLFIFPVAIITAFMGCVFGINLKK